MNTERAKDLFKSLNLPFDSTLRLIDNTVYCDIRIEGEHLQLKTEIVDTDTVYKIETRLTFDYESAKEWIEAVNDSYEHPSIVQGRSFDNLTT